MQATAATESYISTAQPKAEQDEIKAKGSLEAAKQDLVLAKQKEQETKEAHTKAIKKVNNAASSDGCTHSALMFW